MHGLSGKKFEADTLERIHQLAVVGQAALQTNLNGESIEASLGELFRVIADISADASDSINENSYNLTQ